MHMVNDLISENKPEPGLSAAPRRHRGLTRLINIDKINEVAEKKLKVCIDVKQGRPLDAKQARYLQTTIGVCAREDAPMVMDWQIVSKDSLCPAMDRLLSKLDVQNIGDPVIYDHISRLMGKSLKEYRCRLRKKMIQKGDAAKPHNMSNEKWEEMKKEKCKRNKDIRLNQVKNFHCSGSESFVVRREEIRKQESNGEEYGRIRLFLGTHFKENLSGKENLDSVTGACGHWSSEAAKQSYVEMLRMHREAEEAGVLLTDDEICNKVLKNHGRSDYMIGVGYGPKPIGTRRTTGRMLRAELDSALQLSQQRCNELEQSFEKKSKEMQERMKQMVEEQVKDHVADQVKNATELQMQMFQKMFQSCIVRHTSSNYVSGRIHGFGSD